MLLTILVTIGLTVIVTVSILYFKVIKPLGEYTQGMMIENDLSRAELVKMQRLCNDIMKWIEIEAHPHTVKVLKQRIAERMQR